MKKRNVLKIGTFLMIATISMVVVSSCGKHQENSKKIDASSEKDALKSLINDLPQTFETIKIEMKKINENIEFFKTEEQKIKQKIVLYKDPIKSKQKIEDLKKRIKELNDKIIPDLKKKLNLLKNKFNGIKKIFDDSEKKYDSLLKVYKPKAKEVNELKLFIKNQELKIKILTEQIAKISKPSSPKSVMGVKHV